MNIPTTILRAMLLVFLIITLGLTGSLAATAPYHGNPQVNFAVFASAFGVLVGGIIGLGIDFIPPLNRIPFVNLIGDFLNFVFTFAAACALAAGIRVHSCTNRDYLDSNWIVQGLTSRCRISQAATAFLFISAFGFLALTIYNVIAGGSEITRRRGRKGPATQPVV
ncbi:hypothetical protein NADFUDRAFT_83801 [Nadsonia fulvescens var. elongata DSM 6958]|uniref:MARVEL domain-containing protein n=1 Tax=Nadsonia fulvescens var. elongata DSM 6958 TaxID=857566 RepID=A0A1E3PFQ0_9ASCO|nr:hypothetical protein NADFUDRAFT_83801 [Nadsonia fulvescens var. elongata DSM 6958]